MALNEGLLLLVVEMLGLLVIFGWLTAAETALRTLDRHRQKRLIDAGDAAAMSAGGLLQDKERLHGVSVLGRHLILVLLTQLATVALLRWSGEPALLPGSLVLTAVTVSVGVVLPRALALRYPEAIAYASSRALLLLQTLTLPFTVVLIGFPARLVRTLTHTPSSTEPDTEDAAPLRAAARDVGALVPQRHRDMLFSLLDLENVTVEDIMVPRSEIVGVDLEQEWVDIVEQLTTCRHTRVPCYYGNLDEIAGILHLRNLSRLLRQNRDFTLDDVKALLGTPHFVPLKADLYTQLINFQLARQRMGLVVDEYGDIQGMVTLDDLLGHIVGEFTTVPQFDSHEVYRQADGSFVVEGSANVRELNRAFGWSLPESGPKTLNGLILEALEDIPEAGTSFRLGDYTIEIVQGVGHTVRNARIFPPPGLTPRAMSDAEESLGD